MDKKTEALKLALEAFEKLNAEISYWWQEVEIDTVEALEKAESICKQALAEQPAQCPHDFLIGDDEPGHDSVCMQCGATVPNDEQPAQQQEPVAWKDEQGNVRMTLDAGEIQSSVGYVYSVHGERIKNACIRSDIPNGTPLYTSPPASKPWVGLTNEEMNAALDYWSEDERSAYGGAHAADGEYVSMIDTWRYIEAKLKEKNT